MLQVYKAYLSKKTQLTADVFLFSFKLIEPLEINFTAGQYLILMVPQDSGERARRLYSILSPQSRKNSIDLLVKIIPGGAASEYLQSLSIEESVEFQGPAGMFTLRESQRNKVFLATGTGLAPILSIIKSNLQNPTFNSHLFWGARTFGDVYFLDELKSCALASLTSFTFKICLSREQNLDRVPEEERKYFVLGHIQDGLESLVSTNDSRPTTFDYYVCGGRSVVESLREYLAQRQTPANQIYFEKF